MYQKSPPQYNNSKSANKSIINTNNRSQSIEKRQESNKNVEYAKYYTSRKNTIGQWNLNIEEIE